MNGVEFTTKQKEKLQQKKVALQRVREEIQDMECCLNQVKEEVAKKILNRNLDELYLDRNLAEVEVDLQLGKIMQEQAETVAEKKRYASICADLKKARIQIEEYKNEKARELQKIIRHENKKHENLFLQKEKLGKKTEWENLFFIQPPVVDIRKNYYINKKKQREILMNELLTYGVWFYTKDRKNYLNLHNGCLVLYTPKKGIQDDVSSLYKVLNKTIYVRDNRGFPIAKKHPYSRKWLTCPLIRKKK